MKKNIAIVTGASGGLGKEFAKLLVKYELDEVWCIARNTSKLTDVANELGENTSRIPTKVDTDGKITLNSRFLLDALNIINGNQIEFKFSNNLNPIILKATKDQDYIHIVMPLKG